MADSLLDLGTLSTIFDIKPNWITAPQPSFSLSREALRFNLGVVSIRPLTTDNARSIEYLFTNLSKENEFDLLTFFCQRYGRLKRFWLPVYYQEFTLKEDIDEGDTIFTPLDTGFNLIYKERERIYIELKDGSRITRKITGYSEVSFTVLTAFDRDIKTTDIRLMGFLLLARFDQDEIDMKYISASISECSIRFLELPKEYLAIEEELG